MTKVFNEAVHKVSALPEADQEVIGESFLRVSTS